ncbi:hypothetical protein ACWES4_30835, partial [Streptomyces sp. NPDC004011]
AFEHVRRLTHTNNVVVEAMRLADEGRFPFGRGGGVRAVTRHGDDGGRDTDGRDHGGAGHGGHHHGGAHGGHGSGSHGSGGHDFGGGCGGGFD